MSSWQPPLPPGPPPPRHDDFYRPGGMNRNNGYPPAPGTAGRNPSFQFRGNASRPPPGMTDSYRDQSRRYDSREPPRSTESFRPPQGDFNFRHDAPRSVVENSRNMEYHPRYARDNHQVSDGRDGHTQRDNRQGSQRGRGGYRGRGGLPRSTADRPMLQTNREPTPELMEGMISDEEVAVKFKPLDSLSDGGEEMDISSDEEDNVEQPRKKRATTSSAADGNSVPRWSNPDPYTILPPVDDLQRKSKDLVQLIEKSKIEPASKKAIKPSNDAADDFISFDFDDGKEDVEPVTSAESNTANGDGKRGGPAGPRGPSSNSFSHRETHHQRVAAEAASISVVKAQQAAKTSIELDTWSDPSLGSRKRTHDDEVKYDRSREDQRPGGRRQRQVRQVSGGKKPHSDGHVISEWQFRKGRSQGTPSPWCDIDHSRSSRMGDWLHKEIVDFYEYVRPHEFEKQLRTRLVDNLRDAVRKCWPGADVQTFGSFPSELYLPTADMDVVVLSRDFMSGRYAQYGKASFLDRFEDFLIRQRLAMPGTIEPIKSAKVPLVKYVDAETMLKVDVSFENLSGVVAIQTFKDWKYRYPAMPIIVTLIKHYLSMRALNEPVNGGIGGFTVTCLVTSLLQNMPSVQSGNLVPEHHLNEILMEFFNLYGNEFNASKTSIQFDPPGYVPKSQSNRGIYRQSNLARLSIIDPNNPDNDIAGGSSNTGTILDCFSAAYNDLVQRMGDLHYASLDDRRYQSILEVIVGGNYSPFENQRAHLKELHRKLYG